MALAGKLVMATGNAGKIREMQMLLGHLGVEIVPQSAHGVSDADETGDSFEANALIKARHAANLTGLPAIADDSGLAVDALDGRPGVYSARYAGNAATDDDNIDKLLAELDGVRERSAAFHCVACFVRPGETAAIIGRGEWRGKILTARRGTGGFGYDPVFFDPATGLASAELSAEDKNARSHRGKALRMLVGQLESVDN